MVSGGVSVREGGVGGGWKGGDFVVTLSLQIV